MNRDPIEVIFSACEELVEARKAGGDERFLGVAEAFAEDILGLIRLAKEYRRQEADLHESEAREATAKANE